MYRYLIKPLLFSVQPETAHDLMRSACRVLNQSSISAAIRNLFVVEDPRLTVETAGLQFANPVGLAAGFDKNVELLGLWNALGFGHIELGTVTAKPQPGNPKPRIFRLIEDSALINRMGFPSDGADVIAERLRVARLKLPIQPKIGMNIGKSKITEIDQAIDDYAYSFTKVLPYVDYVTVNVSSPNTPGLRQLQERERLTALLEALQALNTEHKPLFVKLAPDLTFEAIEEVIGCCEETKIAGVIATNTTIGREGIKTKINETGGLSGRPLFNRALEVAKFIGQRTQGKLSFIGVGGISSYQDALSMLAAGADMIQVYTGLIYGGPGFIKSLNQGIVAYMDRNRCKSLKEAVELWREGQERRD
jgi:dihydroorotate dehydrogenase